MHVFAKDEKAIFLAALQYVTAQERESHLREACGDDLELLKRVKVLLSVHEEPQGVLDAPAPGLDLARTTDLPLIEGPGTIIGPYKLREQIGEGGFGLVFMAEQQQPIRRKVAVKVIRPGMDSRQVIARFEAERQALALMDHPNIARVLDAGETDGGRPYFAMELVRGVPITDYCDQHKLTPRSRLELFVHVCQAVLHAHQKGIIHRDIKPSNVMVTLHDGVPVVKVIDFGIAKALGQQLTDKTLCTGYTQLVGTPLYMSPEQAELSGLDIDTRSDIYSLGVLLYELLTGMTPFDKQRLREVNYDEMRRIIREEEPSKPSTRLSTLGQAAATVSERRQSDPRRLSQLLRGELDWIVMKGLEKDRNRRYETASAFAADVDHYLKDEPVAACPPSAGYRFRKFATRHKLGLMMATMFAAVVILGVAGLTVSTVLISQSYTAEREAHQLADASFQRSRAAVDEFFTLVSQNKLFDVPGLQPLRKDLLEAAVRYYRDLAEGKHGDPSVRAGLALAQLRLGEVYYEVDRNNDAITTINAALDLVHQLLEEYPGNTELFRKFGGFWKGTRRASKAAPGPDDVAAAERTLNGFIRIWERLVVEDPEEPAFQSDLATMYDRLGQLLSMCNRPSEAVACSQKAAGIWERLIRDFHDQPEYQAALGQQYAEMAGQVGVWAEKAHEQMKWIDKALVIQEKLAANHPKVPQYRHDLAATITDKAILLSHQGNTQEAESLFRRALESWEKLVAEHPTAHLYRNQWAIALETLSGLLDSTKRTQEAVIAIRQAVEIRERLVAEYPSSRYVEGLARSRSQLARLLTKSLLKKSE
jgi:eukaryotic-like serine/threonine-protein kinase